jgi:hypothetical protein
MKEEFSSLGIPMIAILACRISDRLMKGTLQQPQDRDVGLSLNQWEPQSNRPVLQGRDLRKCRVVAIAMKNRKPVTQCASRDEAVDGRPDSQPLSSRRPVKSHSLFNDRDWQGWFDCRQRPHWVACQPESLLVAKTLQHFLDDRQAGDHLVKVDHVLYAQTGPCSEDLDPHGCVNENHRPALAHPSAGLIRSHPGKIPFPQAGAGKIEDATRFGSANEIPEGKIDCCRVCLRACHPDSLFQQCLVKHKIRTLHVYNVHTAGLNFKA